MVHILNIKYQIYFLKKKIQIYVFLGFLLFALNEYDTSSQEKKKKLVQ